MDTAALPRRERAVIFAALAGVTVLSWLWGCVCTVSILTPIGSALIGLSAGQAIEWYFPDPNFGPTD